MNKIALALSDAIEDFVWEVHANMDDDPGGKVAYRGPFDTRKEAVAEAQNMRAAGGWDSIAVAQFRLTPVWVATEEFLQPLDGDRAGSIPARFLSLDHHLQLGEVMQERPYSYKPRPRFFGPGKVFFGLELEVEAPDYDKKREGLELQRNPSWCYAKRDGSLGATGWEMVTHPISMKSWMSREQVRDYRTIAPGTVLTATYKGETFTALQLESGKVSWNGTTYSSISACAQACAGGRKQSGYRFFGLTGGNAGINPVNAFFTLVKQLKGLGYRSFDARCCSAECGFHVHVSREAFSDSGDLHNPMFYRFKVLVNGLLFRKLSQRASFSACKQEPVDVNYFWGQNLDRYVAVNITSTTVEVRIFRGNMREARLRKNLEAVIAALEFATWIGDDYVAPTDEAYIAYVRENRSKFPNLMRYIDAMDGVDANE